MRWMLLVGWLIFCVPAAGQSRPNVLLICVDDLRPELGCYGVDYISSPHIDALAAEGMRFDHHYVQAPTCGASRYALLTGRYGPAGNGALFQRAKRLSKDPESAPPSLPAWFRQHGYWTAAVGKVSHHPRGRGGPDWNDPDQLEMPNSWEQQALPYGPWKHPRGWMHGLANGEIRVKPSEMDVYQTVAGDDHIYPDGASVGQALAWLTDWETEPAEREKKQVGASEEAGKQPGQPFFLAVGILRPHLPFGCPEKYMAPYRDCELPPIAHPEKPTGKTTWHGSGEFNRYNTFGKNANRDAEFATAVRKHYAACVSFADAQVGKLMEQLTASGFAENTIVVLWGDHGWHLGEHAVWGKHTLFEESLRSPLIIRAPGKELSSGSTEQMVETIDLFPTLAELADLPDPEFTHGDSLVPLLKDSTATVGPQEALAYHGGARTIRTPSHRLILHRGGHVELYDHRQPAGETRSVAEPQAKVVGRLTARLQARLGQK